MIKKDSFQTTGEFYPELYCWNRVRSIKNASDASQIIADKLEAYATAKKNDSNFVDSVVSQATDEIMLLRSDYEKEWLLQLLNSISINKDLTRENYHVGFELSK